MSPRPENFREIALNVIRERSFKRGTFTLASGRTSDFYLDMKPSMFSPTGVWALSNLIYDRLAPSGVQAVGGLEMGAVPLIASIALVSHLKGRPLPGFFVRKEVKQHGTKKLVEGLVSSAEISDKSVAIVDDVTTTGGSAMLAVDAARLAGAHVKLVLSVVDRSEGAKEFYAARGIPFESLFERVDFMG